MKNNTIKFNMIFLVLFIASSSVAQTTGVPNSGSLSSNFTGNSSPEKPRVSRPGKPDKFVVESESFKMNENGKLKIDVKRLQGGVNGGGGVSADDQGKRRLVDLIEKDELEYFYPESVLPRDPSYGVSLFLSNLRDLTQAYYGYEISPETKRYVGGYEFIFTLAMLYDQYNSGTFELVRFAPLDYNKMVLKEWNIKPVRPLKWAFTDLELENINDEGVLRIENPNSKKQVAIQKDGVVIINRKEFQSLNSDGFDSKNALFLHETVLRAVLLLNPKHIEEHGTEYVRAYTRRLYKFISDMHNTPGFSAKEAYDAFEIIDNARPKTVPEPQIQVPKVHPGGDT